MLSRRLLTISLLITAVSGYLVFFQEVRGLFWLLGAGIVGAMVAYVFQHQINWWWYRRYPPAFPPEIEQVYLRSASFFVGLNAEERNVFRSRARLFVEAKEFIAQGFSEVAEEIKYIIAYYAVATGFYREEFIYAPYDRIVIYLHPFLSPNIPDTVHAYEIEHEDGTLILSLEQLTAGFLQPSRYYQLGYHLFGELFRLKFLSKEQVPDNTPEIWQDVARTGKWTREVIEDFTGITQSTVVPVLIHNWFTHRQEMQSHMPDLYDQVTRWLSGEQKKLLLQGSSLQ